MAETAEKAQGATVEEEVQAESKFSSDAERLLEAQNFVKRRMFWSAGAGLVPLPVFDMVALTALQVDMVRVLAGYYDVPFRKELVKSIVTGLVGGVLPVAAAPSVSSLIKFVPIVGTSLGMLSMTILGGASSYAVGRVFISHFEAGGTLLDFDPAKMNDFFREKFDEGKELVGKMKKSVK